MMKTLQFVLLGSLVCIGTARAQVQVVPVQKSLPITISLFAESISLPTIKRIKKGGIGIKVGTEFYYRNRPGSQLIQTLTIGYYHHPQVQNGLFINSEFGYRTFIGSFFADAFLGGGALLLRPMAPSYERNESTGAYRKASATQLKFMPSVQTGIGYRFPNRAMIFAHYELFGEMPIHNVVLPHQALSIGTRFFIRQ
ncbi:hypothetical protein G8759_18045 [Spirosoma aureum]|uniref:Outer membrane beta-barrel protein n=1 Tax=Spirosoma aureum TaxID=2692134 RepID=A0A6G9AQ93_9BACT|nr:hypothetical protein [Spirosoma aureum]QIP14383.1 hypothetical protein G8759_18045 [Spirosoma aureum]